MEIEMGVRVPLPLDHFFFCFPAGAFSIVSNSARSSHVNAGATYHFDCLSVGSGFESLRFGWLLYTWRGVRREFGEEPWRAGAGDHVRQAAMSGFIIRKAQPTEIMKCDEVVLLSNFLQ